MATDTDDAFLYERLHTAPGIKLEIVSGGSGYSPRASRMLACQVWCENARDGYRAIDHTDAGAPLLSADYPESERQRISVSHTHGLFAVATLPVAPEGTDIEQFSPQTALGLDVESATRSKALDVRERFLNEEELQLVDSGDVLANIIAWTCKEAMLKLTFNTSADIRKDLIITSLPDTAGHEGKGVAKLPDGTPVDVRLHTVAVCEGRYVATLGFTDSTLRFGKKQPE